MQPEAVTVLATLLIMLPLRDGNTTSSISTQVNGHTYSVFECAYLRPWPKSSPWVARIEEILVRIARSNKVKTFLGVRWFYRRADLLPSAVAEYPPCDDCEREVYLCSGKLDEVSCEMLVCARFWLCVTRHCLDAETCPAFAGGTMPRGELI